MQTKGTKIYRQNQNQIEEIDIKYRTKRILLTASRYRVYLYDDCIYAMHDTQKDLYILDGNNFRQILINDCINQYIISKINNNLIWREGLCPCKTIIYDLKNDTYKSKKLLRYNQIIQTPNKKLVLIRLGSMDELQRNGFIKICSTDSDFFDEPYNKTREYGYVLWKNNYEFVEFSYTYKYICSVTVFDLNFKPKRAINIAKYKIYHYEPSITISNEIIHILSYFSILIIDTDNNMIKSILNNHRIILFNSHYDVFINDILEQFKIQGSELVPYKHKYDIWNDLDKPRKVENIIDVLICLDIYPDDIINVIYRMLCRVLIHF